MRGWLNAPASRYLALCSSGGSRPSLHVSRFTDCDERPDQRKCLEAQSRRLLSEARALNAGDGVPRDPRTTAQATFRRRPGRRPRRAIRVRTFQSSSRNLRSQARAHQCKTNLSAVQQTARTARRAGLIGRVVKPDRIAAMGAIAPAAIKAEASALNHVAVSLVRSFSTRNIRQLSDCRAPDARGARL